MSTLRKLRRGGAGEYAVEPLHTPTRPRGRKLSAVILDFARPLTDGVDHHLFRAAINLAILCWNIALFPEDQQEQQLRFVTSKIPEDAFPELADEMTTWARWLLERKKKLFAHDRRIVLNYTLEDRAGDFHLTVASAPAPLSPR